MDKYIGDKEVIFKVYDTYAINYQIDMINKASDIENELNLIKFKCEETNDLTCLKFTYNKNGYISLCDFARTYEPVIKDILKTKIDMLVTSMHNYLLNENNLILDKNFIFIDEIAYRSKQEINFKFIYLPINNLDKNFKESYNFLMNENGIYKSDDLIKIMEHPSPDKGKLLEKLLQDDLTKIEEADKKNNMDYKKEYDKENKRNRYIKIFGILLFLILLVLTKNSMKFTIILSITFIFILLVMKLIEKYNKEIDFINEEVMDETMIIQSYPYLRKGLLDDKIYITTDEFNVGKDSSNNYVIKSPSISKKHAMFFRNKFGYYIKDLNSTNHTFVNDDKLSPNDERLLVNGDKIMFGNEKYQFYYDK